MVETTETFEALQNPEKLRDLVTKELLKSKYDSDKADFVLNVNIKFLRIDPVPGMRRVGVMGKASWKGTIKNFQMIFEGI